MLVLRSCHCVQRYLLDLKRCLIFSTKHGHGIWANVPASDKYGTPTTHWTWLHVCPNHFFFWKMMNMGGTQLGHDLCPKRKLKCIVQFLDLFLFYGFSPFTLCVPFIVLSTSQSHMKSSFISNLHVNKRCEIGASFQIFVFYDLKSTTHPASQLTFYNSFFII